MLIGLNIIWKWNCTNTVIVKQPQIMENRWDGQIWLWGIVCIFSQEIMISLITYARIRVGVVGVVGNRECNAESQATCGTTIIASVTALEIPVQCPKHYNNFYDSRDKIEIYEQPVFALCCESVYVVYDHIWRPNTVIQTQRSSPKHVCCESLSHSTTCGTRESPPADGLGFNGSFSVDFITTRTTEIAKRTHNMARLCIYCNNMHLAQNILNICYPSPPTKGISVRGSTKQLSWWWEVK